MPLSHYVDNGLDKDEGLIQDWRQSSARLFYANHLLGDSACSSPLTPSRQSMQKGTYQMLGSILHLLKLTQPYAKFPLLQARQRDPQAEGKAQRRQGRSFFQWGRNFRHGASSGKTHVSDQPHTKGEREADTFSNPKPVSGPKLKPGQSPGEITSDSVHQVGKGYEIELFSPPPDGHPCPPDQMDRSPEEALNQEVAN